MRRAQVCMRIVAGGALLNLASSLCSAEPSQATNNQGLTATCLINGITIHTSRIEQKDGKYLLHPRDGGEPLAIAPDQIRSIGSACGSLVPTSANAPGSMQQSAAPLREAIADAKASGGDAVAIPVPAGPQAPPAVPHAPAAAGERTGGQLANAAEKKFGPEDARRGAQRFGVYGANAMGEKLMPKLIEAFAQRRFGGKPIVARKDQDTTEYELRGSDGATAVAVIDLQFKGSSTAPTAFLERKASIGMMSRRAKPEEADRLNRTLKVDLLTPGDGNEHVVALDGLPILINKANPLKQLSLDQIARIFSGEIKNWKDVRGLDARGAAISGANAPIKIHARNDKSGAYDVFKSVVLEQADQPARALSPQAARHESNDQLSDAVAKDPGAIGFAPFPYIRQNHPVRLLLPCGMGVTPSRFTVKTEEYPLARRLYMYTPGVPSEPLADELLQYALSDDAQKVVNDAGFIDQEIEFQNAAEQQNWARMATGTTGNGLPADKTAPAEAVRTFNAAIQGMRRTSVVFRFDKGEASLDAKALQDAVRLAGYLRSPSGENKKFLLVGFADSFGDWEANARLSNTRAAQVAARLRSLGVRVPTQNVMSFSYLAPVACNDAAGQFQNRRVEVWIGK